jgi:23S rRNA pseudouridine2605 synthase
MPRRNPGQVSLERALSKLGLASRTETRALIRDGRVTVDGRPTSDPLQPVVPETARITIDGRPALRPRTLTILLHKPRGVVTTRSDPEGRPTVYTCLEGLDDHVIPVGRLDAATSGLLLLTNDTRFADWVTDPANAVPRVYLATVRGELADATARRLEEGIEDNGEHLAARSVALRKRSRRETHLVLELTEGKNREIRRLLAAAGHEVTKLKRVAFGGLELGDLPPGKWREVSAEEIRRAFPDAATVTASPSTMAAPRSADRPRPRRRSV